MTPPLTSKVPPHVTAVIAYVFGALSGIVVLLMEKHDRFVRFHAMQSTVTFLAVMVARLMLSGIPVLGPILYVPFVMSVIVLWIALMVMAFRGKTYKLPYIGDFAEHRLR